MSDPTQDENYTQHARNLRRRLENIADKCEDYRGNTTEEPHEFARQVMRRARRALTECGDWLDQPEGELIPLVNPGGEPVRHQFVIAGHVTLGEIPWCEVIEHGFHPDDMGCDTVGEAARKLRNHTGAENYQKADHWYIAHQTYATGEPNSRYDNGESFVGYVDESEGHPVTILEEK